MCGIVGVWMIDRSRYAINAGLLALQHRAHDFAGMAVTRADGSCATFSGAGHVWEVFRPKRLGKLRGKTAIGHIRYPTADDSKNTQPIVREWGTGWIAVAHNGNFTNTTKINAAVFKNSGFETGMDTETLVRLILAEQSSMPEDIETLVAIIDRAQGQLEGSGCVLIMTPLGLVAMRDHSGNRPLVYGKHPEGGYVVASEECALTANRVYEPQVVPPGTIMHFTETGTREWPMQHGVKPERLCVFEVAYFCQINGNVFGDIPVEDFRLQLGRKLADEHPFPEKSLVVPVQDSGLLAGFGLFERMMEIHQASHRWGTLSRNKYAGRMFIEGSDKTRDATVRRKFIANPRDIQGTDVILVDDSLVRGTTSGHLVAWFLEMGARAVHFRSAFPVWRYPCRYGIATKSIAELAITIYETERGIADALGVDTLGFISPDGFWEVVEQFAPRDRFCSACFEDNKFW